MSADDVLIRLYSLGYYCAEIEAVAGHVSCFVWRKYERDEGRSGSGPTVADALNAALYRLETLRLEAEAIAVNRVKSAGGGEGTGA